MLLTGPELSDLEAQLARLPGGGLRIVSTAVRADPLDLVRAGSAAFGSATFFASPEGKVIGGLGAAHRIAAGGPDRLGRLDREVAALPEGAHALIGFSFFADGPSGVDWDGFPAAVASVPEATVVRRGGYTNLTLAVPAGSDGRSLLTLLSTLRPPAPGRRLSEVDHTVESRPTPDEYVELVAEAVSAIESGVLKKVVLARAVLVRRPQPFDAFEIVSALRDEYPDCRIFGWQEGDASFVGASPELLVSREGERMLACPLAGSARRGSDPESDRRFGDALLASTKDRHEHDLLVDDFVARLEPLVDTLQRPELPQLQRFSTVQHLATPITAVTRRRNLELAAALHPTGAVGGVPRSEALRFIEKMEGIDRGWYGGGIGWATPDGDGEIALGLRSALVRGERATLYAGNGIVSGSDPAAELEETRLKLRPLLDILT